MYLLVTIIWPILRGVSIVLTNGVLRRQKKFRFALIEFISVLEGIGWLLRNVLIWIIQWLHGIWHHVFQGRWVSFYLDFGDGSRVAVVTLRQLVRVRASSFLGRPFRLRHSVLFVSHTSTWHWFSVGVSNVVFLVLNYLSRCLLIVLCFQIASLGTFTRHAFDFVLLMLLDGNHFISWNHGGVWLSNWLIDLAVLGDKLIVIHWFKHFGLETRVNSLISIRWKSINLFDWVFLLDQSHSASMILSI